MNRSTSAWKFALVGVAVGFVFMGIWWAVDSYNVFNLPTSQQLDGVASYTAPALCRFLEDATFVLCPASLVALVPFDASRSAQLLAWVVISLLNVPIYYCVGLLVSLLTGRQRARRHPSGQLSN